MSFDPKFSGAKSDTSWATITKVEDSLEALILKIKKRKEEGLKRCRDKEETKEVEELKICREERHDWKSHKEPIWSIEGLNRGKARPR